MIGIRQAAVALLLVAVVACSGAPPAPSASSIGSKPTVVIQQPTNGAALAAGQAVAVSGAAADTVGIDRISLSVDGAAVAGTPPGAVATALPFSFNWTAVAGSHTLQVIAYRADGTASDPALVQVTVSGGSSLGVGGSGSLVTVPPLPSVSIPTAPPPQRTRRPRRSRAPAVDPTATLTPTAPTATATATTAPTDTPAPPTATPSVLPTVDAYGMAPDDTASEPYALVFVPADPACPPGQPAAAVACITEQISAPGGDTTDAFSFVPIANTTYQVTLNSCTDVSGGVVLHGIDPQMTYLCGQGFYLTTPSTAIASVPLYVKFNAVSGQMHNLYQLTVIQCAFAGCGTQ